jgi:hypothetical protein
VERTFAWISEHRRTVRDYERLPASHEAMILWAMTALMACKIDVVPVGKVDGPSEIGVLITVEDAPDLVVGAPAPYPRFASLGSLRLDCSRRVANSSTMFLAKG